MSGCLFFSVTMAIPASFHGLEDLVCFSFVFIFCGDYFVLHLLSLWGLGYVHGSQRTVSKNLVLHFYHVDRRDGAFGYKYLYLLNHLSGPVFCYLRMCSL